MFLKPTASFKMDQQTKRVLATFVDPQQRSDYKRSMIEAHLASLIQPRVVKTRREEKEAE